MRKLVLLVAACSGPAKPAPTVSNARVAPAAPKALVCGTDGASLARCFSSHAACEAELQNCRDVQAPHWTCARSNVVGMFHDSHILCYPSAEMCANEPKLEEEHREPCYPVTEAYCRGDDELNCHPTRASCEDEVKKGVSVGMQPQQCVRY